MTHAHDRRDFLARPPRGARPRCCRGRRSRKARAARRRGRRRVRRRDRCARALKQADPHIAVTLVEANRTFTACPFSNGVIAGLRDLKRQQFGYDKVAAGRHRTSLSRGNRESIRRRAP